MGQTWLGRCSPGGAFRDRHTQHCAVRIQVEHPHGAATVAPIVILVCTHAKVSHAVTVEVSQRGHVEPEQVPIIESSGKTTLCVADLLL